MNPGSRMADEGPLAWAERWAPEEASSWAEWRDALTSEQRAEALLPLQAALTGLVAFRQLENHPLSATVTDFRPHLYAVCAACDWALTLAADLRPDLSKSREAVSRAPTSGPASALLDLERSLTDGVRVGRRLLELAVVDAGALQASCDLFLRDLDRNVFFRPPAPLEFANVGELVHAESLTPTLESWKSDAAKMTTTIAFLTLVRAHRFLGIADQQMTNNDGDYRAQVVIAAVRRELRTFTRFLMVQGVETLAGEFEQRLASLDAHHITGTHRKISETSHQLDETREALEALAIEIHATSRTALDLPMPELDAESDWTASGERLRNGIREVRVALKQAATRLRQITQPGPPDLDETRIEERLYRDVWAFRFVLMAFLAKAEAAPVGDAVGDDAEGCAFIREFVRHYRAFAPRVLQGTEYVRRGPLSRAVGALARPSGRGLDDAVAECRSFLAHLDMALQELDAARPETEPFDRHAAAEELRGYLASTHSSGGAARVVAGVFGAADPDRAKAG